MDRGAGGITSCHRSPFARNRRSARRAAFNTFAVVVGACQAKQFDQALNRRN
jgi:hypothetical protein